jgi:hypothetical protein
MDREFDILDFAKQLLQEVEAFRSSRDYVSDDLGNNVSQLPVESRLNTFLRIIGLPQFVSTVKKDKKSKNEKENLSVISPGYSKTFFSKRYNETFFSTNKVKYNGVNLGEMLSVREGELLKIENELTDSDLSERMTIALYYPMAIEPNPQKFIDLGDGFTKVSYKQLFPLISHYVDVYPMEKNTARPFVSDLEEIRVADKFLNKPFIEQVIKMRLSVNSLTEAEKNSQEQFTKSIKDFLGSDKNGKPIFDQVFSNNKLFQNNNIAERYIIEKILDALYGLANKWVKLEQYRKYLLSKINAKISIKTASSRYNVFGKKIEASSILDGSSDGNYINELNKKIAIEEAYISILSIEDSNFNPKTPETSNVSKAALNDTFFSLLTKDLSELVAEKERKLAEVNRNVSDVEKLRAESDSFTGEFTGLSIPDVVIVICALFLLNIEYLLQLLDNSSIEILKQDDKYKSAIEKYNIQPGVNSSLSAVLELEKVVLNIYGLFNLRVDSIVNKTIKATRSEKNIETNKSSKISYGPKTGD